MAKVGDLLSQIQKKKVSATFAASTHKHETPDQLVAKEIAKQNILDSNKLILQTKHLQNKHFTYSDEKKVESQANAIDIGESNHDNSTRHNSTQIDQNIDVDIDTHTRHNSTQSNQDIDVNSDRQTRHNSTHINESQTSLSSLLSVIEPTNPTQLDTKLTEISIPLSNVNSTQLAQPKKLSLEIKSHGHKPTRHNSTQPDTRSNTTRHTNPTQLDTYFNEIKPNAYNLDKLSGNSAKIISFLALKCLESDTNIVTISYQMLAISLSLNQGSISTTCKRLRNSGFFEISGPGGGGKAVRIFKLHESTLKEFSRITLFKSSSVFELTKQLDTTRHINSAQLNTSADTNASSMYSIVNKNTIHTGTEIQNLQEPDSWAELREVDFSALERWNIRNNVIESFKKNKWIVTKEQLEDHIERFARYFTEPEFEARRSKINSPLAFFLGSIKIISRGEPDPIQDVKTQIELAQEISMKNRFAEMESRKRQFETFEKQLDQYRESEFDHWLSGLSKEQQEQIVSPNKMAQFGSVSYRLLLKSYYTETIWPEFKQTILNGPRA